MNLDDSNDEEINIKNKDIFNYKGYFIENQDEDEPKYFEYGAHFSYRDLYNILQILKDKQMKQQKGRQIEKIIQLNKRKIANKERNNTKKNQKENNNLNSIMNIFNSKSRSRNIGIIDNQNEIQNELTFIPKVSFKNNLSIKKEERSRNKSTKSHKNYLNQPNYMKIQNKLNYNNNNNNNNNNNSNNKININSKNKTNKQNQIKKNKHTDDFILTRNKNQKNIYQQIKYLPKNKTLNQDNNNNYSLDINEHKSFHTQMKNINNKSIKKLDFNTLSYNSNSKEYLSKKAKNFTKNKDDIKMEFNLVNKNVFSINKGINNNLKIDKIINNSSSSVNVKNNLNKLNKKVISTPLECLLNSYKSKKIKYSPNFYKKNNYTIQPTYTNIYNSSLKINNKNKTKNQVKNISLKNYIPKKFNTHSDIYDVKGIISVSMDNNSNNKKILLNNKTIEKIKLSKEKDKNQIQTSSTNQTNTNITLPNISTDLIKKGNKYNNDNNINDSNKKNSELIPCKQSLNNLFDKNGKISRNKINKYLINNISSINITDNKINDKNKNNNDLLGLNKTQQNSMFLKIKNQSIKQNKTLINLNKNKENNKKNLMGIPSSYNKKIFISSFENNYNTNYLEKRNKKNNKFYNSYFDKLINNKSKINRNFNKGFIASKNMESKKIYLTSNNIFIKKKNMSNLNNIIEKPSIQNDLNKKPKLDKYKTNFILDKNSSSKKQIGIKTYQNLIKKKDSKNNINISININNNNNIIYNKIINNKNNVKTANKNNLNNKINNINNEKNIVKVNIQKLVKSPSFNKSKICLNNSKLVNNNIMENNNQIKNFSTVLTNNYKNDKKVKFINIQFPKAKFINIFNNK